MFVSSSLFKRLKLKRKRLGRFTEKPIILSHVLGWSLAGLSILLLVLLLAVFPKMFRAVGCIDAAGQAIWTTPRLVKTGQWMDGRKEGRKLINIITYITHTYIHTHMHT